MTVMGHVDVKTAMRYQHPDSADSGSIINARNAQRKSATGLVGHTLVIVKLFRVLTPVKTGADERT
jgi:hypothetical protein